MPGRKYAATTSAKYRFSINGQEKESDVNENITTAMYWEYDSRVGRRWNVDPKPNTSISPYNCFAGNPILFSDSKGDTLGVGGGVDSRNDIKSIVSTKNQGFLDYDAKSNTLVLKNTIELNGEVISLRNAIIRDKGLKILYDMVNDTKNYFYSASNSRSHDILDKTKAIIESVNGKDVSERYPSGTRISENTPSVGNANGLAYYETFSNLSFTLRGDEDKELDGNQIVPNKTYNINGYVRKYDGVVTISPGEFYQERKVNGVTVIRKTRSDVVFHELQENFLRVNGYLYIVAHNDAIKKASGPALSIGQPTEAEKLNSGAEKTNTMSESYYFIFK